MTHKTNVFYVAASGFRSGRDLFNEDTIADCPKEGKGRRGRGSRDWLVVTDGKIS